MMLQMQGGGPRQFGGGIHGHHYIVHSLTGFITRLVMTDR